MLNPAASGLSQRYVINDVSTRAPFSGNLIPASQQNHAGQRYLNAYPLPNIAGKAQQNYVTQRSQEQTFDDFDARGDWNPTYRHRLFGRFS